MRRKITKVFEESKPLNRRSSMRPQRLRSMQSSMLAKSRDSGTIRGNLAQIGFKEASPSQLKGRVQSGDDVFGFHQQKTAAWDVNPGSSCDSESEKQQCSEAHSASSMRQLQLHHHGRGQSINDKIDQCIKSFFSNLTIPINSRPYKLWRGLISICYILTSYMYMQLLVFGW